MFSTIIVKVIASRWTCIKNYGRICGLKKANTLEVLGLTAFLLPSITDPLIYRGLVSANPNLSQASKDTMIRQNWAHHRFNLLMEVVALAATRPLVGLIYQRSTNTRFYKQISSFLVLMLAKGVLRPFIMVNNIQPSSPKPRPFVPIRPYLPYKPMPIKQFHPLAVYPGA